MYHDLQRHKTRDTILWIVVFVLIATLAIGFTVVLVRTHDTTTATTLSASAYTKGTIGADGAVQSTKAHIYTKKFINVKDIEIVLAEDAEIQYKLFYYKDNEDGVKEFISATDWLNADLDNEVVEGAEYVRIVIDPLEDDEISLFEIRSYAKQLTVTYQK